MFHLFSGTTTSREGAISNTLMSCCLCDFVSTFHTACHVRKANLNAFWCFNPNTTPSLVICPENAFGCRLDCCKEVDSKGRCVSMPILSRQLVDQQCGGPVDVHCSLMISECCLSPEC